LVTYLPVASSTLAALLLLATLAAFEAGLTALSRRRSGAAPYALAQLQAEPRRMRQAAGTLRIALLAALLALSVAGFAMGSASTALVTACGLALLHALERAGHLRAFGARGTALGPLIARLLYPLFLLMPRRRPPSPGDRPAEPADAAEAVEDIADRIAVAPGDRQQMVHGLLTLEQTCVEDIMVPRSEVIGIDIGADWDEILDLVARTPHTRLPLYEGEIDRVIGVVHMKQVANELALGRLDRERLREAALRREALFVPEGTTLQTQLIAFRKLRRRIAFVVDEYGDVLGLVTLEDILEEIVGEFTTQPALLQREVMQQPDGSCVVAGSAPARMLARRLGWDLPTEGPRTLSGLIIEQLESIPESGAALELAGRRVEVLQVADNTIRTVRVHAPPA
jgi:CBS domain containing-hemolysin-like protein